MIKSLRQLAQVLSTDETLSVTIEKSWTNTDRKKKGVRIRFPGKGRTGARIVVRRRETDLVTFTYDTSETYSTVSTAVLECVERGLISEDCV